jgi:hypothetical protein
MSSLYSVYLVNASLGNINMTLPSITCNGINFTIDRYDQSSNTVNLVSNSIIYTGSGMTATSISLSGSSLNGIQSFNNAWYLFPLGVQGATGPTGPTGPSGPTTFPPVPNVDFYTGRTNQLININVVNGLTGNSGGIDTKGGTLSSPANTITSVNILTPPAYGTLTATGATGGFTYRSNPGFSGRDLFTYQVTDSTGVVSKNSAACLFNIGYTGTTGTGPNFIYTASTGNVNNINTYVNGANSTLFTATFPGYTGTTTSIGTNALATNRDDNLIYYVGNSAGATAGNSGKIFAYDYINGNQFLLVDANASGSGFPSNTISFQNGGGVYFNRTLYMAVSSSNIYYRINVTPYNPLATVKQYITQVAQITFQAPAVTFGDIAWNHNSNNIVYTGLTGGSTVLVLRICDPDTGILINNPTPTNPDGTSNAQITSSNNYLIYTVSSATGIISIRNLSDGTSIDGARVGTVTDVGEWL